jgi:hypothetical protein
LTTGVKRLLCPCMKTLTHSQLKAALASRKGAEIIGLSIRTDSRARKTGNPFGATFKRSTGSFFTGTNYAANVNKELEAIGEKPDFEAKPRQWGVETVPSRVAEHKGKVYLVTRTTRKIRKNVEKKVQFENEQGEKIPFEKIAAFLPEKTVSARQVDAGLDHPEMHVEQRDIAFDSIVKARIRGETYKVIPD